VIGGQDGSESLEDLLDRLEVALHRLADPGAPLERAVADYEEAGRLLAAAHDRLEAAAARVAQTIADVAQESLG
jgi:exodeoxyribonuclease VII small subunit